MMVRTAIDLDAMHHRRKVRPDSNIIHDVRQVIDELLLTDPRHVIVSVRHGVVALTGTVPSQPGQNVALVPLALRLIWDIDGVVDVVNRLGSAKAPKPVTA